MRMKQRATSTSTARAVLGRDGGDAATGCYLHLRSRRLFMPASSVADRLRGRGAGEEASTAGLADSGSGHSVEPADVAGVSRSSTASTAVDVAARERERRRSGGEWPTSRASRDVESSVSDSECGSRDRRETTPSSRSPGDLSDLESSQAAHEQKHKRRRHPATTTTTTAAPFRLDLEARARMPPAGRDRRVLRRRGEGPGRTLRRQVQLRRRAACRSTPAGSVDHRGHRVSTEQRMMETTTAAGA
ncbi:hypothetical protein ZWY2020_014120 [Hordeum vulgare]|nr:hypothetical protein ZWY2020_014120 [Hordeum vulgare]